MQTSLNKNRHIFIPNYPKRKILKPNFLLLITLPFLMLFILEAFSRSNILNILLWPIKYPKQFFINYLLMFGLLNFFYALPRKLYLALASILISLFSVVGFISREKFILKGEPLLPSDIFLAKEALKISDHITGVYFAIAVICLIALTIILMIVRFMPKETYHRPQKISIFLFSLAILLLFYSSFAPIQKTFSLRVINWSQKMNYDENGLMLGFILNAEYLSVEKPTNYQAATIDRIIKENKPAYPVDPSFKPNIIFVMSEAFWDPTLLKNVSFNTDPIPFFHSLQKTQTNGIMLSPVYGGGTANTEFEVLTGFSTQFLPGNVIPYAQYIRKPIEALPAILKRQGYAASAIHTYDNWFYNRNKVYQDFGFDKFISKEFFSNPEYKGQYIRDTELSKKILEEIKETSKPDFIYAVSMQDHGPYSTETNSDDTIKISGGNLSNDSKAILENYTNTTSDVDQSLRMLIDGLKQLKEPTIVVFFGDHLPMLGSNYSVYNEAGFIKGDNSYQDYLNLHSVPFVTWNNFTDSKQNVRLSSNFLGSFILQLTKKSGSPMTDYLSNLMQNGSEAVINPNFQNRETVTPEETNQYKLLQYDLLIGKEYAYQLEPAHQPQVNKGYYQGDGKATIKKVVLSDNYLEIQGENFVKNDTVYINGQAVKTTFENSSRLRTDIPKELNHQSAPVKVQTRLIDSMGNDILESNVFLLST